MKMENKLKNLQMYAVMVCLLMAISPLAMAEEIASNAKSNLNTSIDESDEVEWQVVWQDETGGNSIEGEPEFVFLAYGAYVAYIAYAAAATAAVMATAYVVVSGVTYIIESEGVKKEVQKLGKKVDDTFKYGGLYYDNKKGNCPNVLFLPTKGKTGYMIAYKIKNNGNRVICHAKKQTLPSRMKKVWYETVGDN